MSVRAPSDALYVTPAKAGVQTGSATDFHGRLDAGLRRHDVKGMAA